MLYLNFSRSLIYSRTSPRGHPTTVDTPSLRTLFSRPVCFSLYNPVCQVSLVWTVVGCGVLCGPWPHLVSLVWTPRYCGHFLSGPLLSTLARFYCIANCMGSFHRQIILQKETCPFMLSMLLLIQKTISLYTISTCVALNILFPGHLTFKHITLKQSCHGRY